MNMHFSPEQAGFCLTIFYKFINMCLVHDIIIKHNSELIYTVWNYSTQLEIIVLNSELLYSTRDYRTYSKLSYITRNYRSQLGIIVHNSELSFTTRNYRTQLGIIV